MINEIAAFTPAQPADIGLLLRFNRELNEHDGAPFDEARTCTALKNLIGRPDLGGIWLIGVAGRPVGYLVLTWGYSLEFGGRDAFLDELYLREDYRGQGIGTRIIQHVLDVCQTHGVKALHLEVMAQNTRAQELYRRLGFELRDSRLMSKIIE